MRIAFHQWEDSDASRLVAAATLAQDEIQVWSAIPAVDEVVKAMQYLNPDERGRANRFRVDNARMQFITARAVLRQLAGLALNLEPSAVSFGYSPQGKPFLDRADSDLSFNVAHCTGLVVIALTRIRPVGVDVEWVDGRTDWSLLADRVFSSNELEILRALPESQQRAAFFNGWTRKEAYLKATGEGLTEELKAIEVTLRTEEQPRFVRLPKGVSVNEWQLASIPLPPEFVGALVYRDSCPVGLTAQ